MNGLKTIFFSCFLILILTSCAGYSFQKKRYSKGFYISKTNSKSRNVKSDESSSNEGKMEFVKNTATEVEAPIVYKSDLVAPIKEVKAIDEVEINRNVVKQKQGDYLNEKPFIPNGFASSKSNFKTSEKIPFPVQLSKRNDFFNFWDNVVTGYYILATIVVIIVLVYYLFTIFPIATALLYAAVIFGVLLLLAGIGMLANNQF